MSIHNIPDRFLNTTLHIFRASTVIDDVGDLSESLNLAYTSLKANIQPNNDNIEFQIQGQVHIQDHIAYINRVESEVIRDIHGGDIAYDEETTIRYTVLGIEIWQAADNVLEDTHHIKLRLKAISGIPKEQLEVENITAKGKII